MKGRYRLVFDGLNLNQVCTLSHLVQLGLATGKVYQGKGMAQRVMKSCDGLFDREWNKERARRRKKR